VNRWLKAILLALFLAAVVSACDWGNKADTGTGPRSGETTTSTAAEPTIESSLEGLTALPSRIAWSATVSLPPEQIEAVKFLVDGDRWWEDSTAPYTFGPPGAYLPARWISSVSTPPSFHPRRRHEFAVRVRTTSGEMWDSTPVRARTPASAPLPRPPGGFRGRYEFLRLSPAELANPLPPGKNPSFTHFLAFADPRSSSEAASTMLLGRSPAPAAGSSSERRSSFGRARTPPLARTSTDSARSSALLTARPPPTRGRRHGAASFSSTWGNRKSTPAIWSCAL
jgi:hypothetical protein